MTEHDGGTTAAVTALNRIINTLTHRSSRAATQIIRSSSASFQYFFCIKIFINEKKKKATTTNNRYKSLQKNNKINKNVIVVSRSEKNKKMYDLNIIPKKYCSKAFFCVDSNKSEKVF